MIHESKHGRCPSIEEENTVCYNDCDNKDYRCGGIEKCCAIGCSKKCINATNFETIPLSTLPPIPSNVKVTSMESHRRKTAQISWEIPQRNGEEIEYVIENRMHIGYTFAEYKLSEWSVVQPRSLERVSTRRLHKINSSVGLKIGRWYRFRVASISANGTRGYSEVSHPFKLNESKSISNNYFVF